MAQAAFNNQIERDQFLRRLGRVQEETRPTKKNISILDETLTDAEVIIWADDMKEEMKMNQWDEQTAKNHLRDYIGGENKFRLREKTNRDRRC